VNACPTVRVATTANLLAVVVSMTSIVALWSTVAGCGRLQSAPVVWDLRTPTYPGEIDPDRNSAVEHHGASAYTVMLPTRMIHGGFDLIRATSPVVVELDPYRSVPAPIDTVSLVFDAADEPGEVLANIDTVRNLFDVEGVDLDEMEDFIVDFRAAVAASGDAIDDEDFVPGSDGYRTTTLGVDADESMKVVLLIGVADDEVSMTLVVRFDNGTTEDWR